jgi:hypothetical protein
LGNQLRQLREASGITTGAAGHVIRASHAKISRMELGRVSFKERDVADLLTLYGIIDEQERGAFLALARRANVPGWWHHYGDILPGWFEMYLGLEQAAAVIRTYEPQLIPGLLQTAEGARAVIQIGWAFGDAGADPAPDRDGGASQYHPPGDAILFRCTCRSRGAFHDAAVLRA